jgi:hypothetical protein
VSIIVGLARQDSAYIFCNQHTISTEPVQVCADSLRFSLTDSQSLRNTLIRIAATVMPDPEARSTGRLPPQSLVKQATVRFYGADRQFWHPSEVVKRHITTLVNSGRAMTKSVTPNWHVPLTRVRLSLYKH